jgi:hypothetical protein
LFEAGVAGGQLIDAAISAATTPQIVPPPVVEYTVVLDNGPTIGLAQYWYPNEFILQANDRAAIHLVNGGAARVVPEGSIPPYLRSRVASSGSLPMPGYPPVVGQGRVELFPVTIYNRYNPSWKVNVN